MCWYAYIGTCEASKRYTENYLAESVGQNLCALARSSCNVHSEAVIRTGELIDLIKDFLWIPRANGSIKACIVSEIIVLGHLILQTCQTH